MKEGEGRWHIIGDTHQHHAQRLLSELTADLFKSFSHFHWHILSGQGAQSPVYQRALKQARNQNIPSERLHVTSLLQKEEKAFDLAKLVDGIVNELAPETCLIIQGVDEWLYLGAPLATIMVQLRRLRSYLQKVHAFTDKMDNNVYIEKAV